MNTSFIILELSKNKNVFKEILQEIKPEIYLWKPVPDKWCLLEIVCHLYDEEREDFQARLKHILQTPADPFTPIDPPGWVMQRKYIQQDYNGMLNKFLEEREQSVAWLQSLSSPPWDQVHRHPTLGLISANKMLANWLAHDYLHFRQIIKLKYDYLQLHSNETLTYAGNW